ncbi:unnamed protein product [Strongylus vulgaris]|uniref:Uncharacterized protein n=1 Tax=Strongylus vulgaris TaxID=40348 RepID=A0A3P7JEJ4_STRVU|nr:unnamed protein product [Strongylus vulgaris]
MRSTTLFLKYGRDTISPILLIRRSRRNWPIY